MSRRAVLAALLLVLAGCSGFGGPPERTDTVTPAPVPVGDTPTPTATPDADRDRAVPPLTLAEGREVDATRLAANHRAALRNRSYHMVFRHERVVAVNGTVQRRTVQTERVWVGANGTYRYDLTRNVTTDAGGGTWYNRSLYRDGDRTLLFVASDRGTDLTELDGAGETERFAEASAELIVRFLTSPRQSVTRRGDRYVVTANGSSHPDQTFTTNNTARAFVDASGLVTELSASYEERARVGPRRVADDFAVEDADRVPEPDWLNRTDG